MRSGSAGAALGPSNWTGQVPVRQQLLLREPPLQKLKMAVRNTKPLWLVPSGWDRSGPRGVVPFYVERSLDTHAMFITFTEFVALREGLLLPDRPPAKGLPRINTTPFTNAQRKRLVAKPVKPPKPAPPTIRPVGKVPQVVPRKQVGRRSR